MRLFLEEFERDHFLNKKISDLELAAEINERKLSVLERNARITNAINYSMYVIIFGIGYFALKKSCNN